MYKIEFVREHIVFMDNAIKLSVRNGYLYDYEDGKLCAKLRLPINFFTFLIIRFRLIERLLRLSVSKFTKISSNEYLFAYKGAIYNYNRESQKIALEHKLRANMSKPLNIVSIKNIKGFDDMYIYGDYFRNLSKEEVSLYARYYGQSSWSKVYSFPARTVFHIHNIVPDRVTGSIYVLTGDADSETFIFEFKNNFTECRTIVGGSQDYRTCNLFKMHDVFFYATDSPFQYNYVYKIILEDDEAILSKIQPMNGPSIYSNSWNDSFVFVTSVEPEYKGNSIRFLLSRKCAKAIIENKMKVYIGDIENGFEEILSLEKDFFPGGLFQFANAEIISTETKLVLYLTSVKKYDGYSCLIKNEL